MLRVLSFKMHQQHSVWILARLNDLLSWHCSRCPPPSLGWVSANMHSQDIILVIETLLTHAYGMLQLLQQHDERLQLANRKQLSTSHNVTHTMLSNWPPCASDSCITCQPTALRRPPALIPSNAFKVTRCHHYCSGEQGN